MAKRRRVEVVVKQDTKERAAEAEKAAGPKPKSRRKKARTTIKQEDDHSSSVNEYVKMVGDNICLRCKQKNLDCYRKRRAKRHYSASEGMLKDFVRCKNCTAPGGSLSCIPVSEHNLGYSQTSSQTRPSGSPPSKRRCVVPSSTPTPPPPHHGDCLRSRVPSISAPASISGAPPSVVDFTRGLMAFDASLRSVVERVERHDQELEKILAIICKVRQQRQEFKSDGDDDEEDPLLLFSEPEEDEVEEDEVRGGVC